MTGELFWPQRKVVVTGATGFIGARLAERLAQAGALVTGLGRHLERVAWLHQAGVALRAVDLGDTAGMNAALAGQEIVFHAAAWLGPRHGDEPQAYRSNVRGPETVVRAAAAAGISRVIHISSIAVYGLLRLPEVSETQPPDLTQPYLYGRTKAMGEQVAREVAASLGLPLTVARPALVYGPGSRAWSVRMLALVQKRVPVLLGGGKGTAWPVYIDNLVDGLMLAAEKAEAIGQAFQFCDASITWRQFFTYYGQMCGRRPLPMPLALARLLVRLAGQRTGLSPQLLAMAQSPTTLPTTKAERLLGYRPAVSLEEGMARTEQWLRQNGYLPAS